MVIITRRQAAVDKNQWEINFKPSKPNYKFPLCGCSDFTGELEVGDKVGVLLKHDTPKLKMLYELYEDDELKFLRDECNVDLAVISKGHLGVIERVEEHVFEISQILSNGQLMVRPKFFDSDKVIVKEYFQRKEFKQSITSDMVGRDVIQRLCKYRFEDTSDMGDFIYLFKESTTPNDQQIASRCRRGFSKAHLAYVEEEINSKNKRIKPGFLRMLNRVKGLIAEHQKGCEIADTLQLDLKFVYDKGSHLGLPLIKHSIRKLRPHEIFRVYRSDTESSLYKCSNVRNWCMDKNVLDMLKAGDDVRVLLGREAESIRAINFRLLAKVSPGLFLAQLVNCNCHDYEDIVIVLETESIDEIEFSCHTGVVIGSSSDRVAQETDEIPRLTHLNYDGLF